MKPRTEIQREVVSLFEKLPEVTSEQLQWAYSKVFRGHLYRTKHYSVCFECGHKWEHNNSHLSTSILGDDCPKCETPLKLSQNKKHKQRYRDYFQILDTYKGYQVVRCFHLDKWCVLGEEATYSAHEIYQHWIHPKGTLTVLAIKVNAMGSFYSEHAQWVWGSELEVRNWHDRYFINRCPILPKRKILPIIRRNGFKGNFHGCNMTWFFHTLLSSPMAETLLKAGQIAMFKASDEDNKRVKKYWSSIKICIRHKYIIKDATTWLDYLAQMEMFGLDIRNPKYICSPDLERHHQLLSHRITAIRDKERAEELKAKKIEHERRYKEAKAKFFDLMLSNGTISISVLKSIDEFKAEGEELNHCVYANDYYNKEESLILSARKDAERLETIEIDLQRFKIKQCAGVNNQPTLYHESIMELINQNMTKIKKIAQQTV